jgi:hypothetical protein
MSIRAMAKRGFSEMISRLFVILHFFKLSVLPRSSLRYSASDGNNGRKGYISGARQFQC